MKVYAGISAAAITAAVFKDFPPRAEDFHSREEIFALSNATSNAASSAMFTMQIAMTPSVSGRTAAPGQVVLLKERTRL